MQSIDDQQQQRDFLVTSQAKDIPRGRMTSYCEELPPLRTSTLQLDLDELSFLRGDFQYDEMDLLSECSTPCAYSPGRFLQMHDVTDETDLRDDVTLWPVSLGPQGGEGAVTSLLADHRRVSLTDTHDPKYFRGSSRRGSVLTLRSPKVYLPLMLFVFLAFSMLGGLMTVIT